MSQKVGAEGIPKVSEERTGREHETMEYHRQDSGKI